MLIQGGATFEGDEPNPFRGEGSEQLASVAYRCAPPPPRALGSVHPRLLDGGLRV